MSTPKDQKEIKKTIARREKAKRLYKTQKSIQSVVEEAKKNETQPLNLDNLLLFPPVKQKKIILTEGVFDAMIVSSFAGGFFSLGMAITKAIL